MWSYLDTASSQGPGRFSLMMPVPDYPIWYAGRFGLLAISGLHISRPATDGSRAHGRKKGVWGAEPPGVLMKKSARWSEFGVMRSGWVVTVMGGSPRGLKLRRNRVHSEGQRHEIDPKGHHA